jgi:hypothetical protein
MESRLKKRAINEAAVQAGAGTAVLRRTRRAGTTTARRAPTHPAEDDKKSRQLLVYLAPADVRWLKFQAVDEDRSMSAIVADALRAYRAAHPQAGPDS